MNIADKVSSLRPIFPGIDERILASIARTARDRHYRAGESVFREGEPTEGLCVVVHGWLKAFKISSAGREQVYRFTGPGESLNEIGAYLGGKNVASASALEAAGVLTIGHDRIATILRQHPDAAIYLVRSLANRIVHLNGLVEDLSLRSVTQRLATMFLNHSTSDLLSRRNWSTQSEMAARLGTVPDVLNRAIRGFVEEGVIELSRKSVRILDRERLRQMAEG